MVIASNVGGLSNEWHEAVATNISGPNVEFPEPWCPAGGSGGFDIVPITNSAELYREGALLHHCVGTYAYRVHMRECYIFSIRKDNERVATLERRQSGNRAVIGQVRGAYNSEAPKDVVRAVRSWLRSQQEFRF